MRHMDPDHGLFKRVLSFLRKSYLKIDDTKNAKKIKSIINRFKKKADISKEITIFFLDIKIEYDFIHFLRRSFPITKQDMYTEFLLFDNHDFICPTSEYLKLCSLRFCGCHGIGKIAGFDKEFAQIPFEHDWGFTIISLLYVSDKILLYLASDNQTRFIVRISKDFEIYNDTFIDSPMYSKSKSFRFLAKGNMPWSYIKAEYVGRDKFTYKLF